ncbi:dTDP-glucose 4,6-dehydratase [Winogradskyella sp.]|uniref:dTDP-glucose 4,6-dehydratase n=1 Tax=Winogradskyella sp. TaxID=1883156 RepID=UPI002636E353|nr:dTDP-glucose 4,6-dehydratase [Winogradskyella sp.]
MNNSQSILITGGAGFIGSNFIFYFLENHPGIKIVNLDNLTYAGDLSNLEHLKTNDAYHFVKGDICDVQLVNDLFEKYKFSGVFHFAAESHVDNSIKHPDTFIKTNVYGTFNLLNTAKNYWMESPFSFKEGCENNRFLHISTDEVYGTLGKTGLFSEKTPYAPNSPYSASKASSDFIVRSYYHTYGMNVVTTNCSNNYGPKQHDEKLIPTIIRKAINNENIPIYGDGKNIRDWLYVKDHCRGIDLAFRDGKTGETYNIGGKNERDNLYIAHKICEILDEIRPQKKPYSEQISFVKDRPGHDFRYAIDASKIENELGWEAKENFETGITKTIKWYLNKYEKP